MNFSLRTLLCLTAVSAAVVIAGCSKSDPATEADADAGTPTGGAVKGPVDMHCLGRPQSISPASCHPTALDGGSDAGSANDGGQPTVNGVTVFNAGGDDDECKYHVSWISTPIAESTDVTFTVTAYALTNTAPATKANTTAEIFLSDTHHAPSTMVTTTETSPGIYAIGPVQFDAPGQWTMRFHFFADCDEAPVDSPVGHIAFFVNVP